MRRRSFLAVGFGAAFVLTSGGLLAADPHAERVLGLWQSGPSYLELNLDGTFFRAEDNEREDVFGTFVVRGDGLRFSYGVGDDVLVTHRKLAFPTRDSNQMQLIDEQQQVIVYRKVRDF